MKIRRLLLDDELLLDVLLAREDDEDAARLWARVELGAVEGLIAAQAVATIHRAAKQARGPAFALRLLRAVLRVFGIARVDAQVVEGAVELAGRDFETALLVTADRASRCHAVVTRRPTERDLGVACLSPAEALAAIR